MKIEHETIKATQAHVVTKGEIPDPSYDGVRFEYSDDCLLLSGGFGILHVSHVPEFFETLIRAWGEHKAANERLKGEVLNQP